MGIFNQSERVKILLSASFSVLFLLFFPILIVLLIPIYVLRYCFSFLLPIYHPELHKIIPTRSISMVVDSVNGDPKWNLCVWMIMEGEHFNIDVFRNKLLRDVIYKRDKQGELVDPEYQQFYSKYFGFYFWQWDRKFDINYHIRKYYESDYIHDEQTGEKRLRITTEKDLKEILKTLTWKPFATSKSPWEFLLIPNYRNDGGNNNYTATSSGNKNLLIFRLHHGLCDGTKIIKLLFEELNGGDMTSTAKPRVIETARFVDKLKRAILFPILAPYQLMYMLLQSGDDNVWHPTSEGDLQYPFNISMSNRIPLSLINETKIVHKVSFSAVITAAISGGIRTYMAREGLPIPPKLTAVLPMYAAGHPHTLQNHFVIAFFPMPVGDGHPLLRIAKTDESFSSYHSSYIPTLMYHLIPFLSGLFHWMAKPMYANRLSTFLLSNFPGPPFPVFWTADGSKARITEMNFTGGIGPGSQGMGMSMLSYEGGVRLIIQADKSILPDDAAVDQLNDDIFREFHLLRRAKFLCQ